MRGEKSRMPPSEALARRHVVEVDDGAPLEGNGRGRERVPAAPGPRDLAARDPGRLAEQVGELCQGLRVRSQIGEDLAQARDLVLGAVQRPVLPLGVVEPVVPATEFARDVGERCGGVSEAPDA